MFSKIRKHFNIIIIFAFIYIVMMALLLIGEKAFYKVAIDDKLQSTAIELSYTGSFINDLITEASGNIIYFTKSVETDTVASISTIMSTVYENLTNANQRYKLSNILVYTAEEQYYNHQNHGLDGNVNASDLKWLVEEANETKISFFSDVNESEEYLVVSRKLQSNGMVVAMCYNANDISGQVFMAEKGQTYLVDEECKVLLAKNTGLIGENVFEKDSLLSNNKTLLGEVATGTKKVEIGKNEYVVSSKVIADNKTLFTVIEGDLILEQTSGWFYKSLIVIIIMSIVVLGGMVLGYLSGDKVNNIIDSKYEYIEQINDEIKIHLYDIGEIVKSTKKNKNREKILEEISSIQNENKLIEFKLNTAKMYAKMFKKGFENAKGEYTSYEMIDDVKAIVASAVKRNNIFLDFQMEVDDRLKFYGDRTQVEAAIANLLLYSIERTVQGGVDVTVNCDEIFADKTNFTVKIKDTSSGMEDDEVANLQEKLQSRKKVKFSDTGIGLDILKMVINKLKCKIEITSTKNVGTEYILKIPQVALFNTDEAYVKQQREKREKAEEEELNASFWKDDDMLVTSDEDEEELTLNDTSEDNNSITMTDMGANNSNNITMTDMGVNNSITMTDMGANNGNSMAMPNMGANNSNDMAMPNMGANNSNDMAMSNMGAGMSMNYSSPAASSMSMNNNMSSFNDASMEEMNRKYIQMMNSQTMQSTPAAAEATQSPYYQADMINSMKLNTLYADNDNEFNEEEDMLNKKKDKMYIYLKEDGINVDDGLDACNRDVEEYEKALKDFYNFSQKNVRSIISLWNERKFEEYYIEVTKITTTVLNLGANNLYIMLCDQQRNYNTGDMKLVSQNVKTIFDEWKKILLYIADYFNN